MQKPVKATSASPVRSLVSFPITRTGETLLLPVYTSQSLTAPDANVTRAVLAIHGISRNADDYWDYAAAGLGDAGGILLVAPHFAAREDDPAADQLYWSSSGWSQGNLSEPEGRPWRISSFEVLDKLIANLRAPFSTCAQWSSSGTAREAR